MTVPNTALWIPASPIIKGISIIQSSGRIFLTEFTMCCVNCSLCAFVRSFLIISPNGLNDPENFNAVPTPPTTAPAAKPIGPASTPVNTKSKH